MPVPPPLEPEEVPPLEPVLAALPPPEDVLAPSPPPDEVLAPLPPLEPVLAAGPVVAPELETLPPLNAPVELPPPVPVELSDPPVLADAPVEPDPTVPLLPPPEAEEAEPELDDGLEPEPDDGLATLQKPARHCRSSGQGAPPCVQLTVPGVTAASWQAVAASHGSTRDLRSIPYQTSTAAVRPAAPTAAATIQPTLQKSPLVESNWDASRPGVLDLLASEL